MIRYFGRPLIFVGYMMADMKETRSASILGDKPAYAVIYGNHNQQLFAKCNDLCAI
jgi:hypothetical protein